jgi:hypothetical protein
MASRAFTPAQAAKIRAKAPFALLPDRHTDQHGGQMTGFIEDGVLRLMGLSDADIAKLNERIPDVQNLIYVLQSHQAQLNRVLTDLAPIIQKLLAKQRGLS